MRNARGDKLMLNQGTFHFLIIADQRLFCERNYSSRGRNMQMSCLSQKDRPSRTLISTANVPGKSSSQGKSVDDSVLFVVALR